MSATGTITGLGVISVVRRTGPLLLLTMVLVSCGGTKPVAHPIAQVGSLAVSQTTYQQNLNYAIKFYRSAYGDQGGLNQTQCARAAGPCSHLRNQLLRRLLEEEAVVAYARSHHIQLSSEDQSRVDAQLARIDSAGSVIAQLVTRKEISLPFLRSVLQTELLVHKVETHVVPRSIAKGFAYHIKSVLIPIALHGRGLNAYRKALNLATDGRPIPRRATVHVEWAAPAQLAANVRRLVEVAQPGQFVGPFKHQHAFLVVQILGSGSHRLGRAERQARQTAYFHRWIERMLAADHPNCYSNAGKGVACPGPID